MTPKYTEYKNIVTTKRYHLIPKTHYNNLLFVIRYLFDRHVSVEIPTAL